MKKDLFWQNVLSGHKILWKPLNWFSRIDVQATCMESKEDNQYSETRGINTPFNFKTRFYILPVLF